jgi:hypothetical protein
MCDGRSDALTRRARVEPLKDRLAPAAVVNFQNPLAGILPQAAVVDPHLTAGATANLTPSPARHRVAGPMSTVATAAL